MEPTISLDINEVKNHLTTNKFITPSSQSYQSFSTESKGFHTYGSLGLKLKNNLINLWRKMFVTGNVYEIETPTLQLKEILTNSGHIGKFHDYVVSNGIEEFRADHLVKDYCETNGIKLERPVDDLSKEELLDLVKKYSMIEGDIIIKPKSLMFGVNSDSLYLRPEIAQGMFTEYDQFNYKLPFGLAQVGKSYRNEISPQPFTRLREFTQAEVEYFFDPCDETHPMFDTVATLKLPLLSQAVQLVNSEEPNFIILKDAVESGIVVNQIVGYFLGITYNFVKKMGLSDSVIRFRQHLPSELAHYARQCWDLEIKLANGQWLECLGCAHRGDYDLKNHNVRDQNTIKKYETKVIKLKVVLVGSHLKDVTSRFYQHFKNRLYDSMEDLNSDSVYLDAFKDITKIVEVEQLVKSTVFPYVIEPSLGIDRMIFALANNLLRKRTDDSDKIVFGLPIKIAPYEIAVYALSNHEDLVDYLNTKLFHLNDHFSVYYDASSVSIGKKYVRSDGIGIGLCITVDFETLKNNTVTIRHTNNGRQDRYYVMDLVKVIDELL